MHLLWRATIFLLFAIGVRASDSLAHARYARELLGPKVWSRVIRVHNTTAGGVYPRELHALVFELAGMLWFYTDTDGTQSFSIYQNRLAQDEADFSPLLRAIDPGFAAWSIVAVDGPPTSSRRTLPNGCFIESVAALREQLALGGVPDRPQLLSYYVATREGQHGHTVLVYELSDGIRVVDPTEGKQPKKFPDKLAGNSTALAAAVYGGKVIAARTIPLGTLATRESASALAETSAAIPAIEDRRS